MVDLPSDLLSEIDGHVSAGRFASREAAIVELVRLGLATLRATPTPRHPPGMPPPPPGAPPRPGPDEPIRVDPRDTKWLE